jgi:DegV family protein with EDD domain
MLRVKVVADSASDLSHELASDLDITVVPINVQFGDQVYRDGVDLSTDEFYRRLQTDSAFPKTSAPSPGTFRQIYEGLAQNGDAIVSIHVAAKLSATYDAARLAGADLSFPVSVIDTDTASMACGLLVIKAARAARDGASLTEIEALLSDAIPRTITYGVFSTLEYLQRGGRIGRAQAFVGSLLRLSPILAIRHGEVVPVARVRTRPRAVERLCQIVGDQAPIEAMSVMYATVPREAEELESLLSPLFPPEHMHRARVGPSMGTYVGPDAVGVSLIKKAE